MSPTSSAPPRAKPRSSGPDRGRRGFSLVEVVIATAIIAFAMCSIIGLMSITMISHQDSSTDSVFAIMTDTALQEVRNSIAPEVNLRTAAANYNPFTSATPPFQSFTGYLYFDEDGQIAQDAPSTSPFSTELGVMINPPTLNATNKGSPGVPLASPAAAGSLPASALYLCTITTVQPKIPAIGGGTATSPNLYIIKLTFVWPPSLFPLPAGQVPAGHTRVVLGSVSNHTN